jgi:hypothetical protein
MPPKKTPSQPKGKGKEKKRGPSRSPPDASSRSSRPPAAPQRHNPTGSTQSTTTSASTATSKTSTFLDKVMNSPKARASPTPPPALQRQGTGGSTRSNASMSNTTSRPPPPFAQAGLQNRPQAGPSRECFLDHKVKVLAAVRKLSHQLPAQDLRSFPRIQTS